MEQSAVDKLIFAGARKAPTMDPARGTRLYCQARCLLFRRYFLYAAQQGDIPQPVQRLRDMTRESDRAIARRARKARHFRTTMWINPAVSPRNIKRLRDEIVERGEDSLAAVALAAASRAATIAHVRRATSHIVRQAAIEKSRRLEAENRREIWWEHRRAANQA